MNTDSRYTSASPTLYKGKEPGTTMTAENVERLRASHPDDPQPLPEGHRACEWCGVACDSEVTHREPSERVRATGAFWAHEEPIEFGRCADCAAILAPADELVQADPALSPAPFRVAAALMVLAYLDRPVPADLTERRRAVALLADAGMRMRFTAEGVCSPWPWAHLPLGLRSQVRRAYAAVLKERFAATQPPVALVHPTGSGCLLCGVSSVPMPALDVSRRGGVAAAVQDAWRSVTTSPSALGVRGPGPVSGFVCPRCDEAIGFEGAIGPTARQRAVVEHVRRTAGDRQADRLRSRYADADSDGPRAWGGQAYVCERNEVPPLKANSEPWAHVDLT